jgi:molybdopterin molybdotransferase
MSSDLIELDEARRLVLECARPLESENVALDAALGRVLARDLASPQPIPDFDNSAMDGFAIRCADVREASEQRPVSLELVGESRAGHPFEGTLGPAQAAVISTGAMVPGGADAVIALERANARDGRVEITETVKRGNDIRQAGEDIAAGSVVLRAGRVLGPAALGVAASLGHAELPCTHRPRVAVITTGDELLEPGQAPRPGAIFNSNGRTVPALAQAAGAAPDPFTSVGDDADATREAIAAALAGADLIAICGGVSVGPHDHVRPTLGELGVEERFWGIALRPGKPTWFGTRERQLVFGLPGNPVSAMVTFTLLAAPALRALVGTDPDRMRVRATLEHDYEKRAGRAHAVRCRLRLVEDGWRASPTGPQGSHVLSSMLDADGLAIIPAACELARAGDTVDVELLDEGPVPS